MSSKSYMPAWLSMTLFAILGIVLYFVSSAYQMSISGYKINEIVKDISIVFLTTCILEFLLSVSSMKRLSNDIAHEVKLELLKDYSRFTSVELDEIEKGILLKHSGIHEIPSESLDALKKKRIYVSKDIESCVDASVDRIKYITNKSQYYNSHERSLILTLTDTCMHVSGQILVELVNPAKSDFTYRYQPMHPSEIEAKSYRVQLITLNGEPVNIDIGNEVRASKNNSSYFCKNPIILDLKSHAFCSILIKYEFVTDVNSYFHAHKHKYPCSSFKFRCELRDERSKRDIYYGIKWEYFMSAPTSKFILDSTHVNTNDNVQFSCLWAQRGEGYAMTLSTIQEISASAR